MSAIMDLLGAALLVLGAFFCFAAALGQVRFPDVMGRLHAATKPQVFGLILVLTAVMLTLRSWHATGLGVLIVALQLLTAPVSGHMVARTAYRTGQWGSDEAVIDELGEDLADAGFVNTAETGTPDGRHRAGRDPGRASSALGHGDARGGVRRRPDERLGRAPYE